MWRPIAKLVGALLFAVAAIGIVFMVGMRTKSPHEYESHPRIQRTTKPLALKGAEAPGAYASVIRHVGRTTGQRQNAGRGRANGRRVLIALPYGLNTDWLKNCWRADQPSSSMKERRTRSTSRRSFRQPQ